MAKTFLDQLVEYPAKVMQKITQSQECVGLILNKSYASLTEDDYDTVLEQNIFDYQYVDSTTQKTTAYVWVELDITRVQNEQIKDVKLYVTVMCHKNYMDLDPTIFSGLLGNRRDNIVRYIDKEIHSSEDFGIGKLILESVRAISPINNFTGRELTYTIPDFNKVKIS